MKSRASSSVWVPSGITRLNFAALRLSRYSLNWLSWQSRAAFLARKPPFCGAGAVISQAAMLLVVIGSPFSMM